MKTNIYVLPFLFTGLLSAPVYAQKLPPNWKQILKQAAKQEKIISNPARLLPKPLNYAESFAREARLLALSALSRALRKNPNLPNTAQFADYASTLTLMGEKLPPVPAASATAEQKRQYAEQVRQAINQALQTASPTYNVGAPSANAKNSYNKLAASQVNWAKRRHEMTLANAQDLQKWSQFEKALAAKKQSFSWGEKNWDEIRIAPVALPRDPQDPLFGIANTLYHLAQNPPKEFSLAMDFISYSKALTPYQKQAIWQHLAHLNDVIGYTMVYAYMALYHKVPAISAPGLREEAFSPSMQQYARNTQLVLIEQLKKGQEWSELQTNLFLDISVFLPGYNGKDVLAALTYLEPDAALYLLAHPKENKITQNIRRQIQSARTKAKLVNGLLTKAPLQKRLGVFNSFRRLKALAAYSDLLSARLEKINKRIVLRKTQIQSAKQAMEKQPASQHLQLSYQLYCQLDLQHLQQLHDKIFERLRYVQQELMGLYKTAEFK